MPLSLLEIRKHFPQIQYLDKQGEVYLDSAATTLKLDIVIDSLKNIYEEKVSNVHRGEHHLSLKLTEEYEKAREQAAQYVNASSSEEIVFTSGTTYGINLLAYCLADQLQKGDEIVISEMEHHSNLLPWKRLADTKNLSLKIIPVHQDGTLDLTNLDNLLTDKTKILSITHVSNLTGIVNPIKEIIQKAKAKKICTIVDAAQSASCLPLDVQKLGCDFLVFSGHKVFAPSGTGILFGKKESLSKLSPFFVGGGMVQNVSFDQIQWADSPYKFEAGTPFIEGSIVLGKVLSFIRDNIDIEEVLKHEQALVDEAALELSSIPNFKIIGSSSNRSNILSFVLENCHCKDLAFLLTQQKVAIRAGHHCCIPLVKKLKLESGTIRCSFSVYNQPEDIQTLKKAILKSINILELNKE